jgi:hypothetical protein
VEPSGKGSEHVRGLLGETRSDEARVERVVHRENDRPVGAGISRDLVDDPQPAATVATGLVEEAEHVGGDVDRLVVDSESRVVGPEVACESAVGVEEIQLRVDGVEPPAEVGVRGLGDGDVDARLVAGRARGDVEPLERHHHEAAGVLVVDHLRVEGECPQISGGAAEERPQTLEMLGDARVILALPLDEKVPDVDRVLRAGGDVRVRGNGAPAAQDGRIGVVVEPVDGRFQKRR